MYNIKCMSPEELEPLMNWNPIGQGNFGHVFKVKHKKLKVSVAVKKFKENTSFALEELFVEAGKIKHASENLFVIQLLGIVKDPPCIVMEWMEYGCLSTMMERVQEIPWALKYRIINEVALGMNWLHSLSPPLLHLDLKPRNVLLNDALHIRITDFGLSKYTSVLDDSEEVGGTLEYMSPETFEKGYEPSKTTDVYSFAILSAVVLRGVEPYPVTCSVVIRMNVAQGQRPSFESLEKMRCAKNLDRVIEFTKRCWDHEKQHRPLFDECSNQWEIFISAYCEKEIKDAVKAVLNMMDCTDSPGSTTDVPQSSTLNTQDMSDAIQRMQTLHIAENPPAKQNAVPPQNFESSHPREPVQRLPPLRQPMTNVVNHGPRTPNYRTGAMPVRNPQFRGPSPGQVHQPRPVVRGQLPFQYNGPNHRTISSAYSTGNVGRPQVSQGSSFKVNPGHTYQPMHWAQSSQMPFYPRATRFQYPGLPKQDKTYNINISDNTGPIQIGDNNKMYYSVQRQYPPSNARLISPQPGQTARTSSFSRTENVQSPQPIRVSQVSYPTNAFSDVAQAIQETGRQTDQPLQIPTTQSSAVNNSLQRKDNNNSSSSPGEQANSSGQ